MRLFVAIVPPDQVLAELAAAVTPLQRRPAAAPLDRPGRWHLTLAFLGEVHEAVLPELSIRLARARPAHPPQRLAFRGARGVPARRQGPRALGRRRRRQPRPLAALAASVAAGARRAGAPPPDEGRRYRPHLTLARCREPAASAT